MEAGGEEGGKRDDGGRGRKQEEVARGWQGR